MRLLLHYFSILILFISWSAKGQILDYGATEFCKFSPSNPLPITATPVGGTFSSNSANLVVNPVTGEIDLTTSVIGGPYIVTYTVGLSSANASMFIVDVPIATINYPNTQLCMTPLPPPSQRQPSSFGPPGGTFSISPAATGLSINTTTGLLSFNSFTPQGTYTITYTVNQAGCIDSETFDINLFQPVANPTLSYPQASYCQLETDPTPTFTPAGGTFSASPAGLSINATTGVIDLSASSGGSYTITYTIGNLCGNKTANFNLTVIAEPANPTLSYPQASYCKSDTNPSPTFTPAGGTFSALPAGLSINTSTGVVDIVASTVGTYTITYSVGSGLCTKTINTSFTLNPNPTITTFTYPSNTFCQNDPNPSPTVNPAGGSFASTAGLSINAVSGVIDLTTSITGTYNVNYTVTNLGCSTTQNFSVTINPAPAVPTLSYSQTAYCVNDSPTTPTFTPAGGTFSALPAGLSLNTSTGVITPSTSATGTYTVTYTVTLGSCSRQVTTNVTINPNPTITTFTYPSNTFCQNDPNPSPTVNPTGGSFASTAGLSINAVSGLINLASSTAGTYSVSYTITSGGCNTTQNFSVTINPAPAVPTLSYSQTAYCVNDSPTTPTFTPAGGTFSALPAGLSLNTSTGVITPSTSATGTYTVTYTVTLGSCSRQVTTNVTINPNPTITTFTYPSNTFCQNDPNPSPTVNPTGGSFASTAGLSINAVSGLINLASSTAGTYSVSYTITSGGCNTTQNFSVTINPAPAVPTLSYSQTAYCVNDSPTTPTFTPAGGTFSALPAGLSLNTSTGVITPSTSATGTYTVTYTVTLGGCSRQVTTNVTINPNPVITTFTYPSNTFCQNDPNPSPTVNPTGGSFASTAGLSINAVSGLINLASSTAGTYSVSYTITSGGCSTTQNFSVTINPAPAVPTLSYSQTAYCVNDSPTTPTFTPAGGTFSALPAGLSLNKSTGVIKPSTSATGTYTVTYTVTLGSCSRQVTSSVTINPNPTITTFTYPSNTFCQNDPNPSPTVNPTGGSFASTAGLSINAVSGLINLASSTAGTYSVSYTITSGGCSTTQNFSVTINPLPTTPTVSYPQTSYCTTGTNPSPTVSQAGGTFSASPAGLSINASSGVINLASSTANSYTVTYTLTNGCGSNSGTFNVSIVTTPATPTISYSQPSYCTTDTNPSPTVSQAGGTFSALPVGLSINASTGVINLAGSTSGAYTITYTLANGSCTSSNTFTLTVVQTPTAPTTTNGTRCGAGSVVLTASGGTNGNYRWYEPDGTTLIAGETNNTYTTPSLVVASTTYFVSAVNGSCESARVPVQALVQLTPTTITVTGVITDVTTCNPANSGAVNISITGGQAPYIFTWSNGATVEDIANLTAGSYSVTVRDFFNCQSVVTSFTVGTNIPNLTLNVNANIIGINEGESTNLSVTGSQTLVSAVWSPAEGLSDANSLNPTANPNQTTTYTVTATDNRGCTNTSQITIEVFGSELFVPNAFTPQNSDPKNQSFKVFGNGIGEITLRIFDKLGQVVYETSNVAEATTTGWNGTFNGKDLPTGIFTWELKGKYLTGNELSYKGKKSGTVLLVR
ncbi:hypothetical protein AD998_07885 [bacterium 336/3]|nr:hypothetical protein AD998_07885 [bacterium 336/3]